MRLHALIHPNNLHTVILKHLQIANISSNQLQLSPLGLCVIDPTRSKRLTYSKKKTFREALSIEAAQDIIANLPRLELKDRCWSRY